MTTQPKPNLKAVRRTAERRRTAELQFREAVFQAHARGATLRAIADEAGLSHVRILQIVKEAK